MDFTVNYIGLTTPVVRALPCQSIDSVMRLNWGHLIVLIGRKSSNNRVCRFIESLSSHGEDIDKADCSVLSTITYLTCPQLEVGWGMEFSFMTGSGEVISDCH